MITGYSVEARSQNNYNEAKTEVGSEMLLTNVFFQKRQLKVWTFKHSGHIHVSSCIQFWNGNGPVLEP